MIVNRPTINFSCCCCGGYSNSLARELKHLQMKSGLIDLGLSIRALGSGMVSTSVSQRRKNILFNGTYMFQPRALWNWI
jgi:hypothetical protein